jgi:leucyl aminopeptidase
VLAVEWTAGAAAEAVVPLRKRGSGGDEPGGPDGVDPGVIRRFGASGKVGQVHPLPDGRWLVGIGDGDPAGWRGAGAALTRRLMSRAEKAHEDADDLDADPDSRDGAGVEPDGGLEPDERPGEGPTVDVSGWSDPDRTALVTALVTGLVLGSHRFRVSRKKAPVPPRARLLAPAAELDALNRTIAVATACAEATALARDLASMPSDVKTPTWLVETAARVVGEPGVQARIWTADELAEGGFGGILAVGGGSSRPPALLQLGWSPDRVAESRHLVLVGKGVTFDTGGISIKPADGMHLMRTDMSGGAAVIGAMRAIARLGLPLRVTALVPAAENHVSGSAYRPGDVVRHFDGTTTEVTNTDAEGRMVLADALGYAVAHLDPDLIVDVATLTGAMKVSLGLRTGGLLATSDELAELVITAGERAGERWWRMPLLEHLAEEVPSDIADVRQAPKGPGGITAALFLRHFVRDMPWAHLDIAGPARCDKPYAEVAAGATGFAARTLVELALGLADPGGSGD